MTSALQCAACRRELQADARFCPSCGAAVASPQPPNPLIGPAPVAIGGERRFLILLFCDMVGSTEISGRLDPEEVRDLMRAYQGAIAKAINDYGGHFARDIGDGALIYFGWPQAHENDAERAVRAGLAIVEEVGRIDEMLDPDAGIRLQVRVGIHAGSLVVERTGEIFGDTPNIAARVQTAAPPGSVLMTEAMVQLLGERCLSEAAGRFALKGVAGELTLYRALGFRAVGPSVTPSRGELVGREAEMAGLLASWTSARQGRGRSVAITAEAGIGKSRLLQALHEQVTAQDGAWLELAGSELLQGTPFHPVIQLLERTLDLRAATALADRLARLHGELGGLGVADDAAAPLADLLGLPVAASYALAEASPERRRQAILGALEAWILARARRRPTVLAIEDHHWLDPSTAELITRLSARLGSSALLVVMAQRPPSAAHAATHPTALKPRIDLELSLGRLAEGDIRRIVAGIVEPAGLAGDVVDQLVRRTGGNPLFARELARLMADRRGAANEHEIPTTLAGSLTARLDALGLDKEIAQFGAVLGGSFSRSLALALGEIDGAQVDGGRVDRALQQLVRAGILSVRAEAGQVSYSFTHALIRDAAYEALLRSRRRDLHLRAAEILSHAGPDGDPVRPEIAAYHWDRGGEAGRAAEAWHEAALSASGRGAFVEAEAGCRKGLDSLARLAETAPRDIQELKLSNLLVISTQITHGYSSPEVAAAHERVRALTEKTGDVSQEFEKTATEWVMLSTQGKFIAGNALAEQICELADRVGRPGARAHGQMMQMTARYRVGDLVGAEQSFVRGRAFYQEREFDARAGSVAQTFGTAARNAWLLGMADTARERSQYALLAMAERPFDLAFAQYMAAILAVLVRDPELALRLGTQSLEASDTLKFPVFSAISRVVVGRATAELGDTAAGVAMIEEGIGRMERTGSRNGLTLYLAWAAEALGLAERWDEAEQVIERALTANPEELFFEAECLRLRGEIRAALGKPAIDDFVAAHRSAERMGARICRIRTWLSTRRLGLDGDPRLPPARDLARLYDEMAEGRDTPDMKEAAALREALVA